MAVDKKFFSSIGKKILLWFLIISITPAAGITFISYWNSKKLIEEQLAGLLNTTADMVSKEIHYFIATKKAMLVDFATDGLIRDGVMVINAGEPGGNEAIIERLNHHLSINKVPLDHDIIEAFVIDLRGKVVASSNETRLGMDASHKDYFIEGWRHGIYVSDMWWPATEDGPIITMSRVITNVRTGYSVGMMVITIRGNALSNATKSWDRKDKSIPRFRGMGCTGEVYVVNEDHLMITESRFAENAVFGQVVQTEPVKRAFLRGEEMSESYLDYRGVKVLGTSRLMDEPMWLVVAEKDLNEALGPIRGLRNISIVLSIVGAMIVIIIAFFITRSLTSPIHKLVEATKEVAKGDLDYRILTTSKDEIGQLSNSFNEMIDSLKRGIKILKETQFTTMVRLAMLAEKRDPETGEHLGRIKEYSRLLAEGLRHTEKYKEIIDDEFIETLVQSSPLHDIGKVAIPDNILLKNGRLTKDEFNVMKQHGIKGAEILEGPEFLKMGYEIAIAHHEKYDGSGYPYGLSGDAIPLSARIVALADMYDALTSKRVYKETMSHEKAYSIILSESGKSFDPEIVRVFIDNVEKFIEVKERLQPLLASPSLTVIASEAILSE